MRQPSNIQYRAALYMRLSRDDELEGESGSIKTQRLILRNFAEENGIIVVDEYIDDGWTGTNFDRPAFQRMIEDVEEGKVNCVMTKDLSRLGRNYILAGQYTEIYFPSKGVRYIAVNDGVDSLKGESDIAPFLNILNEMHAKQTSKKLKAAHQARQAQGYRMTSSLPLGYARDSEKKGHLVVDPETKPIVERIFALALTGVSSIFIAKQLCRERIPTPSWINCCREGRNPKRFEYGPTDLKYAWSATSVRHILDNEVYIGNNVYGKNPRTNWRSKKRSEAPPEEWTCVEGTHEAIVSREVFERAHEVMKTRYRSSNVGDGTLFSGLLWCSDCGHRLTGGSNVNKCSKERYKFYLCPQGARTNTLCSRHYISEKTLSKCVLGRIQHWASLAIHDEKKLIETLSNMDNKELLKKRQKLRAELTSAEKRKNTVDDLFVKTYENWIGGKLSEANFNMLSQKYQKEQGELESAILKAQTELQQLQEPVTNAEQWIAFLKKYTAPTVLTREMVVNLVQKIIIHETVKDEVGNRTQEIEIYYRFIGKID